MSALVFIDTNILLDFYRQRGREKGLSILQHIDDNLEHFITGSQVEMEFKKNRQRVILISREEIKAPSFGGLKQLPAFLAESKQSSGLASSEKRVRALSDRLRKRIGRVLHQPTTHDRVYKTAQRLFRAESDYNLSRDKKVRFTIRRLARKRFYLGYPPRKDGDTSIGDAVNWEWIAHCAAQSGRDVVIVTRDSDYGTTFEDKPVLNDWLGQEFRERVSRRRKLILTDRLTEGLERAKIKVTREEAKVEQEFLEERRARQAGSYQSNVANILTALSGQEPVLRALSGGDLARTISGLDPMGIRAALAASEHAADLTRHVDLDAIARAVRMLDLVPDPKKGDGDGD